MLEADLDGNGTIEFPEFLELMKEKYGVDDQESDLRLENVRKRTNKAQNNSSGRPLKSLTGTKTAMLI